MSEVKAVVRSLLDLPSESERRNSDVITGSGYATPSEINPLYEALGLYDLGSPQFVQAFCCLLDASLSPPEIGKKRSDRVAAGAKYRGEKGMNLSSHMSGHTHNKGPHFE